VLERDGIHPVSEAAHESSTELPGAEVRGEEDRSLSLLQGEIEILDAAGPAQGHELIPAHVREPQKIGDGAREVPENGKCAHRVHSEFLEIGPHVSPYRGSE
jgi:hypothetical protein